MNDLREPHAVHCASVFSCATRCLNRILGIARTSHSANSTAAIPMYCPICIAETSDTRAASTSI